MKSSKRTMTTNNFDPIFESNLSSIKSTKSSKSKGDHDLIKHRNKHKDYFDCLNEEILSMNNNHHHSVVQQDIGDCSHGKLRQENNTSIEQWRLIIYILFLILISFLVYRCSILLWTKPKKTFLEQIIENFGRFFTF